jgi:hypothetical protein
MWQAEPVGVEKKARHPGGCRVSVVEIIADDGASFGSEMHTDLMPDPGTNAYRETRSFRV